MSNSKTNAVIPAASLTSYSDGTRWSEGCNEYVTAESHAALAVGAVVGLWADSDGPVTYAPATLANSNIGVVVEAASASGGNIIVQTRGFAEALCDGSGNAITADDNLEVINGTGYFVLDHATTKSANTVAAAVDALSAAQTVITVFLLGRNVDVAAS